MKLIKDYDIDWDEVLKIPEFQKLSETKQNQIWHQEGNALIHTQNVCNEMKKFLKDKLILESQFNVFLYSALFHDIGKINTTIIDEEGIYHCPNHANSSFWIAKNILPLIEDLNEDDINRILNIISHHMYPMYVFKSKHPYKYLLTLCNNLINASFYELWILKRCDILGSKNDHIEESLNTLDRILDFYYDRISFRPGTTVRITKVKDLKYNNQHPNNINEGYCFVGPINGNMHIGGRIASGISFCSSIITKIIDKNTIQTKNSIYKIEKI